MSGCSLFLICNWPCNQCWAMRTSLRCKARAGALSEIGPVMITVEVVRDSSIGQGMGACVGSKGTCPFGACP